MVGLLTNVCLLRLRLSVGFLPRLDVANVSWPSDVGLTGTILPELAPPPVLYCCCWNCCCICASCCICWNCCCACCTCRNRQKVSQKFWPINRKTQYLHTKISRIRKWNKHHKITMPKETNFCGMVYDLGLMKIYCIWKLPENESTSESTLYSPNISPIIQCCYSVVSKLQNEQFW